MRPVIFLALALCWVAPASGNARHVVLIVWDGMRPDFVSEKGTPNLWKLAHEGTTFRHHHSVWPSLTNVNGTALATGVFPQRSGVIGNNEYRPELDRSNPIDTAVTETIRKADEISGGKYLALPTIPELVQASGGRTAVAGTKWVATLFDRPRDRAAEGGRKFPSLTAGTALPAAAQKTLLDSLGTFPAKSFPNIAQDGWTTSALLDSFWKEEVPAFSLLWLSDPDFTAHETAPGSPKVLSGIANSDAMLGRVIQTLKAKDTRADTDVFVVSDHGFSTIERSVDIPALLNAAGFHALKNIGDEARPGAILVVGNGGTTFYYVTGHDEEVTGRLVAWLQQSDFAGVIFARNKIEGAFTLQDAHLDKTDGPDVIVSFRWNEKVNEFGAPGMIMADWNRTAGKGTHATLSKFDLHNTLIAAGPDFRRGYVDELPSGNIDVAPTILHLLGITSRAPLDGRILSEALVTDEISTPIAEPEIMETAREFPNGKWRQTIKVSTVGDKRYFDEGNGAFYPTTR